MERTLKDADGRSKVVDSSGSLKCGNDNGCGWNEIVGECVVQISLFNARSVLNEGYAFVFRFWATSGKVLSESESHT